MFCVVSDSSNSKLKNKQKQQKPSLKSYKIESKILKQTTRPVIFRSTSSPVSLRNKHFKGMALSRSSQLLRGPGYSKMKRV